MSLIVTVWVDGAIVMAGDSRTSFTNTQMQMPNIVQNPQPHMPIVVPPVQITNNNGHHYDTANKVFLCPNNCGISTCGAAHINNKSIEKYLTKFVTEKDIKTKDINETVDLLCEYFRALRPHGLIFHVAGYFIDEQGNQLQKCYTVQVNDHNFTKIEQDTNASGAKWDGETSVFSKLFQEQYFGGNAITTRNLNIQVDGQPATISNAIVFDRANATVFQRLDIPFWAFSTQEAVNFARYIIKTTIDTMEFTNVVKTVGGPIDILVIQPENSKWLAKKKLS